MFIRPWAKRMDAPALVVALKGASPALAVPVLDGLVSGWPQDTRPRLGDSDKKMLTGLMQSMPAGSMLAVHIPASEIGERVGEG